MPKAVKFEQIVTAGKCGCDAGGSTPAWRALRNRTVVTSLAAYATSTLMRVMRVVLICQAPPTWT